MQCHLRQSGQSDDAQRIRPSKSFIQPLDNQREWFRYHHLFAELLRTRLSQMALEETVKIPRKRAVDWLNGNGHFDLAIDYALGKTNTNSIHGRKSIGDILH